MKRKKLSLVPDFLTVSYICLLVPFQRLQDLQIAALYVNPTVGMNHSKCCGILYNVARKSSCGVDEYMKLFWVMIECTVLEQRRNLFQVNRDMCLREWV